MMPGGVERRRKQRRSPYAWLKYSQYLLWEFRWSIGVFSALVLGGGLILKLTYKDVELGYMMACYAVFCMIFFETGTVAFPKEWYLQPLFFAVPLIGLGAVADSVVRLGYLIFTKKQQLPEWHKMNAALLKDHVVVCGLGKLGYRIAEDLLALGEAVVGIEKEGDAELVGDLRDRGVPILVGDARQKKLLEEANVKKARVVIVATDDDLANIDAALTAREIQPGVRVILRLFDDTLAAKFSSAFDMPAISTATRAASAFVAAATEKRVFQSFELCGRELHVVDVVVRVGSRMVGRTVGQVQKECDVNVVLLATQGQPVVNPGHETVCAAGDELIVIAPLDSVSKLNQMNALS